MKEIKLTGKYGINKVVLVDDEDFENLNKYKWHLAGKENNAYPKTTINYYDIPMHRMIMCCIKSDGKMIDHIDGNTLNNQKLNLRFCTNSENQKNKKGFGTSKYLGVNKHIIKNKYFRKKTNDFKISTSYSWRASININGKSTHVGSFKKEEDAALAYNRMAIQYHGEFARLNKI